MVDYVIQTQNLSYRYSKSKKALADLSINVPKGSIYGFLGPNGAGKSTTMRLLTGVLPDDTHSVTLFGRPFHEQTPDIFKRMGCLVESPALYPHLTGYENLHYISCIREIEKSRIDEILKIVNLWGDKKMAVKKYSLGMKQRLAIAMALIDDPELLLLDEPANGLDPKGMREIRMLLTKLNREYGTSIFISSHILSEIEKLCTHTAIIAEGKLRFEGTMKELAERFDQCRISLCVKNAKRIMEGIDSRYKPRWKSEESVIEVSLEHKEKIPSFVKQMTMQGAQIYEVKILQGIEDWFMSMTQ